jgi:membrane protein DedA with SNARE-associated domain
MFTIETVLGLLHEHRYIAMFGVLFLSGFGLPVPEEITLLASGLAVGWEEANYWLASVACVLGILASDTVLYCAGRRWGKKVLTSRPMRVLLSEKRQAFIERLFARHGNKAVFIARFFAILRFGVFTYAGQHGMRFATFIGLDLLGALITGPVTIFIGVYAARSLADPKRAAELARGIVREQQHWIYIAFGLLVLVIIGRWLWSRRDPKPESP